MNESKFEKYLDQLSSGKIHKEDVSLCEDFSEEELRGISFAHTLKSISPDARVEKDFLHHTKEELHAEFQNLYGKKSFPQITRVSESFSPKSFWSFLYPVSVMALLLVVVSLGFLNIKTTPTENFPDETLIALNTEVEDLDISLMQGEDELGALTNDLFVFESSFDGELTVLQNELDIMLEL